MMKDACPKTSFTPTLACSWRLSGGESSICLVVIAKDELLLDADFTYELVKRHEGHCNGWPGDHPGARRWEVSNGRNE
jgi:hypothetical protein